jgi:truncated hemoglobin YjbI
MNDTIGQDLSESRAWIEPARQALQAASQDEPEIQRAVARLERMAEDLVVGQGVEVNG